MMTSSRTGELMNPPEQKDILNSWKEIAVYLNRGVRTVQRWEIDPGLPVRRPRGRSRSAVIALRSELDEWIKSCPIMHVESVRNSDRVTQPVALNMNPLIAQSRQLRSDARRLRHEMRQGVGDLLSSLNKISENVTPPPIF